MTRPATEAALRVMASMHAEHGEIPQPFVVPRDVYAQICAEGGVYPTLGDRWNISVFMHTPWGRVVIAKPWSGEE